MRTLIIGYVCLCVGILIMGFSVYQVYALFTNQIKPLIVFHSEAKSAARSIAPQDVLTDPSLMTQFQMNMLSTIFEKQINQTMNTGATVFLYYFLMLFGFRVAMIGTYLVRPITVKLRSSAGEQQETSV